MRDLEIRGAGNILGARQHGHIAAVGFELYTRLLAQAVDRLKKTLPARPRESLPRRRVRHGERAGPAHRRVAGAWWSRWIAPLQITLPLSADVPESYVPGRDLRLQLYRRMARLRSEEEVDDMRRELEDRFGPLPDEVDLLLYQLRLKVWPCRPASSRSRPIPARSSRATRRWPRSTSKFVTSKVPGPARVGRLSAWLPLDARGDWRATLTGLLRALVETRSFHVLQHHQ